MLKMLQQVQVGKTAYKVLDKIADGKSVS